MLKHSFKSLKKTSKNHLESFFEMLAAKSNLCSLQIFICIASFALTVPLASNESTTYMYSVGDANQSLEIEDLKRQLQTAKRNLHEYKSQLFRSSHPQDKAKIAALNQQIAEKNELNEKLNGSLKILEGELLQARKQAATLEVTADALSAMILHQRKLTEALHKDYLSQLGLVTDELQLMAQIIAEEQHLTARLNKEVQQAGVALASYEKKVEELENVQAEISAGAIAMESYLKDAHQQDSASKLALDELELVKNALHLEVLQAKDELEKRETLEIALKNELSDIVARYEKQQQEFQKLENDLKNALFELSILKFQIAEAETTRQMRDGQNAVHINHLTMALDYTEELEIAQKILQAESENKLSKHIQDNETLKQAIQEKEEVLNTALLYYEATLKNYQSKEEVLQASLLQSESRGCHLQDELDSALTQNQAEKQRLETLEAQKQHLQTIFEQRHFGAIALEEQLRNDQLAFQNNLAEKELAFSGAALHYLSMLDDYRAQVEAVENRLAQAEKGSLELQAKLENALAAHLQQKKNIESLQAEKEHLQTIFEKHQSENIEQQEKLNQAHASLQNALLEKEVAFSAVAYHYLSMLNEFKHQIDVLEDRITEKEAALASAEQQINDIQSRSHQQITTTEQHLSNAATKCTHYQEELAEKERQLIDALAQLQAAKSNVDQLHQELANSSLENSQNSAKYTNIREELAQKDSQLLEALSQLQSAKSNIDLLHQQLANSSLESSHAEERLISLREAFDKYQAEQTSLQATLNSTIDKLKAQTQEDKITIAQLSEELAKLALETQLKANNRKQEYEQQLHSFSTLVERQDRALADAGTTLHQAQVFSEQLQKENEHLKQRLAMYAETAEHTQTNNKGWGHPTSSEQALAPLINGPKSERTSDALKWLR